MTETRRGEPLTRIAAARDRALTMKLALLSAAGFAFGAAMILVRVSHPATSAGASDSVSGVASIVRADDAAAEVEGFTDGFGSGSVGPAFGSPSVATHTS